MQQELMGSITGQRSAAKRIAFGRFDLWEPRIRQTLDQRYDPVFVDLKTTRRPSLEAEFDAVIPLQIPHYTPLGRYPWLNGAKFFHPSRAAAALCDDKLKLTRFLSAQGFAEHLPRLRLPGPPYPYLWKKREGWWGMHHLVRGPLDEQRFNLKDKGWFAQEVVPGEVEFATHVLRCRGEVRYCSTVAYTMAAPMLVLGEQNPPLHSTFLRVTPFLNIFAAMLARLDYEGTACIDYKIVHGKPVVFEINPRFGGSLCGDITAYVDAYVAALGPLPEPGFFSRVAGLPRALLDRSH